MRYFRPAVLLTLILFAGCGEGPEDLPRVLAVSLDGADLEFIEPMIEAGELPTLAGLFEEGVHGELYSTVPPVTPPAWLAATTGKNPGRTGIYQWAFLAPGTYSGVPASGAAAALEKRVWDLVGEAGGRVIAINIPFTFPPMEVNGVLVCGIPADENGVFAYPPVLAEQLRQRGYVPYFKGRRPLEDYLAGITARAEMAAKYLRTLEWNLSMVSFRYLDEVCHFYIEDPEAVRAAYMEADRALGRLIEAAGPDVSVLVFSDHGYFGGAYERYFSINRWLFEEGYLMFRGRVDDSLRVVPFDEEGPKDLGYGRYQVLWPLTRAFSISDCHSNFGHIHLNVRGREPSGAVEPGAEYEQLAREIKRRLLAYRDPLTDEQIVRHVFMKRDLYTGERVESLPDLVFQTVPGVLPFGLTTTGFFELTSVIGPIEVGRNYPYPGDHEREGMFALLGRGVRIGERLNTELLNLVPTILYLMGLAIPADFDGRAETGAFTEEHLAGTPVELSSDEAHREGEPELILSPEPPDAEARAILDALGYLH